MSDALAPAHEEIAKEVGPAPAKNVDETGWKQAGGKHWLWAAVTAAAALFVIHRKRGAVGLKALPGETIQGLVCSDSWSASRSSLSVTARPHRGGAALHPGRRRGGLA